MSETLKIAFWGLGSIAKRHIRNLQNVLCARETAFEIDIYRHSVKDINDSGIAKFIHETFLEKDLEGSGKLYDVIFIPNPTSLHYETVKICANYCKHMFIEKPVFDDISYSIELLGLKESSVYYVACPLRYSSVLQYVKSNINLEKVFSVRAVCSSYLPEWRPGQDYRDTYSAHKSLGGGVNIDLIHEWDYLTWMFGSPEKVIYSGGKFSNLDIDSDDLATYIGVYKDKLVEVHLDYFGRKTQRELYLYMPDDTVRVDLVNSVVEYMNTGKIINLCEERDAFQRRELEHFLDIINDKCPNDSSIIHALGVMKIAMGVFI